MKLPEEVRKRLERLTTPEESVLARQIADEIARQKEQSAAPEVPQGSVGGEPLVEENRPQPPAAADLREARRLAALPLQLDCRTAEEQAANERILLARAFLALDAQNAELERRTRPDGDMADRAVNEYIRAWLEGK